jgi:hypothetical protein
VPRSNELHRITHRLESIMLQSIRSLHRPVVAREAATRSTLAHLAARWLLRRWQAACRRAERADRFVPYY